MQLILLLCIILIVRNRRSQLMMKEGFVGLAIQNAELNAELKEQNRVINILKKWVTNIKNLS